MGRRARIIETPSLTVIDDCYNANPDSVKMAIASAGALGGRLVCILGDMLELGELSEQMHREVGEAARAAGALLLTGRRAQRRHGRRALCQQGGAHIRPAAAAEKGRPRAGEGLALHGLRGDQRRAARIVAVMSAQSAQYGRLRKAAIG